MNNKAGMEVRELKPGQSETALTCTKQFEPHDFCPLTSLCDRSSNGQQIDSVRNG